MLPSPLLASRKGCALMPSVMVRFAAAVVTVLLLASVASATVFPVAGDAHVSSSRGTANFGTLSNLYVGDGNTALLQFDLSTLPAGTASSQIAKATLTIFVNRVNNGGAVNLSPVTSAWTEAAVTYT